MGEPVVLSEIDARGVATVRLNRPEVNNAYNGEMVDALIGGIAQLGEDDAVRVIVIRGNGPHFQAGADLNWIQENALKSFDENLNVSRATTKAIHDLTTCLKPTISLIHGGCFGGGTGIAAACDIVVAENTAIFAITEARWGLAAVPIFPQLISRIGAGNLRRYSLSCERFNAQRGQSIGFVDEVCEPGALDETIEPIIDSLLHCPPGALAATKLGTLKYAGLIFSTDELEEMALAHANRRMTKDAEEGLNSFLEKRKPHWYPPK